MPKGSKIDIGDTFLYGSPQRRSRRQGVWLRVKELPEDIREYFSSRMRPNDKLSHVVVSDIKWDGVELQAWCADPNQFNIREPVWTVIVLRTPDNPDWVCEKYLGIGPRDANFYAEKREAKRRLKDEKRKAKELKLES